MYIQRSHINTAQLLIKEHGCLDKRVKIHNKIVKITIRNLSETGNGVNLLCFYFTAHFILFSRS